MNDVYKNNNNVVFIIHHFSFPCLWLLPYSELILIISNYSYVVMLTIQKA